MKSFPIVEGTAWLLLALLLYAPWAYGCTSPATAAIFTAGTLLLVVGWLVGRLLGGERPKVHPVLFGCAVLLLGQGWWMILNAHFTYDYADLRFVRIPALLTWAPGVVDRYYAVPLMLRITGLLGITCFVADLSQSPTWRLRLWRTMAVVGVSIVVLGLLERTLGAEMIFWQPKVERYPPAVYDQYGVKYYLFFATYYYNANAGAFINLVVPVIGATAVGALRCRSSAIERSLWICSFILSVAAAIATASKGAMTITALLCVLIATQARVVVRDLWNDSPRWLRLTAAAALAVTLYAAFSVGWTAATMRWTSGLTQSVSERMLAAKICVQMARDSGAWGFGVGNFRVAFPHYTNGIGTAISGIWSEAHQDYLQTLVEWGWVGAVIWGVLVFGSFPAASRAIQTPRGSLSPGSRQLLVASVIALAGVLIHALVDFPLQVASLQFYAAIHVGMAWGSRYWTTKV